MTGKISRVVAERGFGFITGEDGQDYFFHRRAFDRDLDPLVQGLQVTFNAEWFHDARPGRQRNSSRRRGRV